MLTACGFTVHAVSRCPPRNPSCTWHVVDLLDANAVRALFTSVHPSHLLHLAWTTEHAHYWTSPNNLEWVEVSLRLFREFHAAGGRRAVAAGTCAEYTWDDPNVVSEAITECSPRCPQTLYGISKNATFDLLRAFCRTVGLGFAWGRVFFPYGPGDERPTLIPTIVRSLMSGQPALCTHGRQQRDFIYVDDVASAFEKLLNSEVDGAFNIGTGTACSIAEVAQEIGALLQRTDLIRLGALAARADEPSRLVADTTKLSELVGFRPRVGLREGLRRTVTWWLERPAASSDRVVVT
jgi:nucleoside-diphosphate-sugar epimerase